MLLTRSVGARSGAQLLTAEALWAVAAWDLSPESRPPLEVEACAHPRALKMESPRFGP